MGVNEVKVYDKAQIRAGAADPKVVIEAQKRTQSMFFRELLSVETILPVELGEDSWILEKWD